MNLVQRRLPSPYQDPRLHQEKTSPILRTLSLTLTVLFGLGAAGSASSQIVFNDVADAAGIGADFYSGDTNHGGGILWLDYNDDTWPDMFLINGAGFQSNLYRNEGDGTFSNQNNLLPDMLDIELTHAAYADYDNDGDEDIYIGTAQGTFEPDGPPNILLKNMWVENGGGTIPGQELFVDVAVAAGVDNLAPVPLGDLPGYGTFTVGWVDYNRDSCADLYVGNMAFDLATEESNANFLYRNNCDGTFTDATDTAGLAAGDEEWFRPTLAFVAGHLNDDLWPDLYVVNAHDESPYHHDFIFINNGNGTFSEVASLQPDIGDDSGSGMGLDFGDLNLDGYWDIYISDLVEGTNNEPTAEGNVLYLGTPGNSWLENSAPAAGVASMGSWGVSYLDADQDGDEDLFVGVMGGHEFYENDGAALFTDISDSAGMADGNARGSAWADYDKDGDLDLAAYNMHGEINLYENASSGMGNYLQVTLEATISNRSTIGARVEVSSGGEEQVRQIKGGVSSHSQDEALLHFGLGENATVDQVRVYWPSGVVQTRNNVAANQVLSLIEGPSSGPGPFLEEGGQVTMEAENIDSKVPFGPHSWTETTAFPDNSGDHAMQAVPDIGAQIPNPRDGSATMSYLVNFSSTGTFYAWLRAWPIDDQTDRVHMGIDGAYSNDRAANMVADAPGEWGWYNMLFLGDRAFLEVDGAGVHTINISMAEDGMVVDKIVLTTDPDFVPSGLGPPESPRDDMPVAVEPPSGEAPTNFTFERSYPNPFSAVATIPFMAPTAGRVHIAVYDLLGREVTTLLDGEVGAGRHDVLWDASRAPSGIYFVRLSAGSSVVTQRVSLVR